MPATLTRPEREVDRCPDVARPEYAQMTAADYRVWDRQNSDEYGERRRVLEHMDPLEQRDAAWECACGQRCLPSDRKQTCNCWGKQNAPTNPKLPSSTPDLMSTLTPTTKEPIMSPDAPYGYCADGVTPRKSNAGRRPKAAAQLAAPPVSRTVEPDPEPPAAAVVPIDPLKAAIAELDNQIARAEERATELADRVTSLHAQIGSINGEIGDLDAQSEILAIAKKALEDADEIAVAA